MERMFEPFVKLVLLVVTHFRPHLDEIAAWWLALRHGQSIFPGLERAKTVLWNAGTRTPDGRSPRQWKEESGALLFGVGGAKTPENPDGAEFDEHGLEGRKTCTFVLMLEALGLFSDPRFRELLKFTLSNDREGSSSSWDAARMLKALHAHTVTTAEVVKMYFEMLDAHFNRVMINDPSWMPHKHATLFDGHLAQWLWDAFAGRARDTVERPATARAVIAFLRLKGRPDLSEIARLAERDHTKGAAGPFDIVTMFSELVENGSDETHQQNFVYTMLNAKYAEQQRFIQASDEAAAKARITWIGDRKAIDAMRQARTVQDPDVSAAIANLEAENDPTNAQSIAELKASLVRPGKVKPEHTVITDGLDGVRPFKVVSMVTDNEEILKTLRGDHPDADFYIRRLTTKHTVVNGPKWLMDSVCAELRIAENIRRNGRNGQRIPTEHLRKAGNIPGDPVWSYHREGGQMLNGSLTSPGMPHTLQSLEGIWSVIARVLRREARFDGRDGNPRRVLLPGAKRPPKPEKAVTQPAPAPAGSQPAQRHGRNRRHRNRGDNRQNEHRSPSQPATPVASTGTFGNRPFAAFATPVAEVPTPVPPVPVTEVPAEAPLPAPDATEPAPAPVTESPSVPVAEQQAAAPKRTRKPRAPKGEGPAKPRVRKPKSA